MSQQLNKEEIKKDIIKALDRRLEAFKVKSGDPKATYSRVSITREINDMIDNYTYDIMQEKQRIIKDDSYDDMDKKFNEIKSLADKRRQIGKEIIKIAEQIQKSKGAYDGLKAWL